MKVTDLPTPALIADADGIEENMRQMDRILQGRPVRLRPHYKSHKCAALAHRQIAVGAIGMTCAKLSEAEDLIFSGVRDVLIANQIVEPAKISRVSASSTSADRALNALITSTEVRLSLAISHNDSPFSPK